MEREIKLNKSRNYLSHGPGGGVSVNGNLLTNKKFGPGKFQCDLIITRDGEG